MIDLESLNKMKNGCGFKHRTIKKVKVKSLVPSPKKSSIKKVYSKIKLSPGLWRQELIILTGLSTLCVDSCLKSMLASGVIVKEFIRNSGPHPMYRYRVA